MARALTIERSKVSPPERAAYFAGMRERRDRLRVAECNFWVYEDPGEPGLFVEFIEARDAVTLARARASVFDSDVGAPILTEKSGASFRRDTSRNTSMTNSASCSSPARATPAKSASLDTRRKARGPAS